MMSDNKPSKRIINEIEDLMRDNDISRKDYSVELVNRSKTHLIARISGPPDTQYSGGIFTITGRESESGHFLLTRVLQMSLNLWTNSISFCRLFIIV
jgi:hypothetical protein